MRSAQAEERRLADSAWQEKGHVFINEFGEPCDPRNAFRALRVAAAKAGLSDAGLHTLRHSAASVRITRSVPRKVVSGILEHSSIAITGDIYGHVSPDVARQAMHLLGEVLDREHGRSPSPLRRAETASRVVEQPQKAIRGRSGSLRTRPLNCGFPQSG